LEATCQRCNETLRATDRYCSVCGLPQLTYSAEDVAATPALADAVPGAEIAGPGTGVAWRPALQAALLLAIPAGVLCSGLSVIGPLLGLVWMSGAAAWAVVLYSRRANPGRISAGSGARIGLVTGLLAGWLTFGVNGVDVWTRRFLLHQGGQMDSDWLATVNQLGEVYKQLFAGAASVEIMQAMEAQRTMMLTPNGRAESVLVNFMIGTAFLVVFSVLGGAAGARWMTQPRGSKV
jgi:hypothetical protein